MHLEIQVALNFVISHLYNKLPRRRVNLLGEELERALKMKFAGHWYPDKPMKGSAYRCLKTGQPTDPVFERAAQEANVSINDILENLPTDMCVWIDPGEVSYRVGEKGQMKVLWSESSDQMDELNADREVTKTFNPDAQIFQPIDAARKSVSPYTRTGLSSPDGSPFGGNGAAPSQPVVVAAAAPVAAASTPWSPHQGTNGPQMMTTAAFAQTKFGSTKLKTSSKRTHRMSPTEFSNYIKQRALQQQQQKAQQQGAPNQPNNVNSNNNGGFINGAAAGVAGISRPRSLSPQDFGPFGGSSVAPLGGGYTPISAEKYSPFDAIWSSGPATANGGLGGNNPSNGVANGSSPNGFGPQQPNPFDTNRQLLEGLSLGLNAVPYRGQYQHLLVAN